MSERRIGADLSLRWKQHGERPISNVLFFYDKNPAERGIISHIIENEGLKVCVFDTPADILTALHCNTPLLIIADLADDFALMHSIHPFSAAGIPTVYFILPNSSADISCEQAAVCKLLHKPFDAEDLILTVRDALGIKEKIDRDLKFGNLSLDPEARCAIVNGDPVKLTAKETALLYVLMQRSGEVVSRKELFKFVWGSDFLGESRTVDTHIRTLRLKLGMAGEYIKSVRGQGYCFRTF